MIWIVVILLTCLTLYLYFKFFKLYKVKNVIFVDGSLGTGKTFFSVSMAVRLYKKQLRRYKVLKWLCGSLSFIPKMKEQGDKLEEPYLYSNIRLRNIDYVKVTADLLCRKGFRFGYRSVLLIDEFSLMADQYTYKDREISERLSIFFKLWRHETKGGYIVINSQSTSDLHYSIKYVLSDYLYIHHKSKFPLITCLKVQEMAYCGDKDGSQVTNVMTDDIETNLRVMLVFNRYYKYYDTYCYSIFTDGLPVYRLIEHNFKGDSLKDPEIVSFKQWNYLKENYKDENPDKKKID